MPVTILLFLEGSTEPYLDVAIHMSVPVSQERSPISVPGSGRWPLSNTSHPSYWRIMLASLVLRLNVEERSLKRVGLMEL